jgi:hypothetical protein
MATWAQTQNAMQAAIVAASGLATGRVIWKWQNAPAPGTTWIAMGLTPAAAVGQDFLRHQMVVDPAPHQEVELYVSGVREVTLTLEAYTAEVLDDAGALALADRTRTALLLPSVRDALRAVGVTPFDSSAPVQFLPEIVAVGFRGKAVLPIRCWMPSQAVSEFTTYIQTIGLEVTADGVAIPLVIP